MNALDGTILFLIMLALAAIPGASTALVVARSASHGIASGLAVVVGIVLGDLTFILLTVLGLAVIAETLWWLFPAIKFIGVGYVLWVGISLLMARPQLPRAGRPLRHKRGLSASFLGGLFLTLGDIKAIVFYASLLPMLLNPAELNAADLILLIAVTVIAVGGVKLLYALSAGRLIALARRYGLETRTRQLAGGLMIGSGGYLLAKA